MRSINSSVVKKLLPRLKSHAFLLALAMLSAVVSISLTLLIPVLVGNAIDNIIGEGQVYFEAVTQIIIYDVDPPVGQVTYDLLVMDDRSHRINFSRIILRFTVYHVDGTAYSEAEPGCLRNFYFHTVSAFSKNSDTVLAVFIITFENLPLFS